MTARFERLGANKYGRCVMRLVLVITLSAAFHGANAQTPDTVVVERLSPSQVRLQWTDRSPVDIYVATSPEASTAKAKLLAKNSIAGTYDLKIGARPRPYFILVNRTGGTFVRVAERALPLDRGSNFRDVGGYSTVDGKHVRWGKLFRSAAMPVLSERDFRYIEGLGIKTDIDLRSVDERAISPDALPSHLHGRYVADDYRFDEANLGYGDLLVTLRPQFEELFVSLLQSDDPTIIHCSAGQDRTGVATALVLSAFGVPQNQIVDDYLLSQAYRRPEFEVVDVDPSKWPGNTFVEFRKKLKPNGQVEKPYPLYDDQGVPYLMSLFNYIDKRWGSVPAYLGQELGIGPAELARLKEKYLE